MSGKSEITKRAAVSGVMLNDLNELLEPILEDLGYELLLWEWDGQGANTRLRIYIDHFVGSRAATSGSPPEITLDDCERVSREVSALLDVADPVPHRYRLEVSSPGLDRPLVKPAHFVRFEGSLARITMAVPIEGQRKFVGQLAGLEDECVCLNVDGQRVVLPLADIRKARLVPELD